MTDNDCELTIAVCTYRRFGELQACLKNIERQTADRSRFRVLIIDNSLQPQESEAFRNSLKLDFEVEYVVTPQNGIAYARNQAIRHCRTPYLGYVDDDVFIAPDWAEVLLDTFDRYEGRAGCVSGKILPRFEAGTPPPWLKEELLWPLAVIDWGETEKVLVGEAEWFVTASIGFDIRALRLSGGFSEYLGRKGKVLLAHEDLQIVTNLRRMGYSLVYNPDFIAEHSIPASRTTQKWYCRDAFWQTVSRAVYASGKAFEFDGRLAEELTKAAEKHEAAWREQPDKQSVEAKLALVTSDARKLMKRHGYDTGRSFPEPEFRTFFIVTPTFNAAETIEETLRSVLSQKGNHFIRYHVQDGGSTDGTVEILKEWSRRLREEDLPFRLECKGVHMSYSSAPNSGLYDAIAKAFSLLPLDSTDVMGWLNADDVLNEGALDALAKVFEFDEAEWAVGATSVIDDKNLASDSHLYAYPRNIIREGLCDGHYWKRIQQQGSFWRKELWDAAGGINAKLKLAGDWDLWRRFARHAEPIHLDQATGRFRIRAGQLSSNLDAYSAELSSIVSMDRRRRSAASLAGQLETTWFQRFDVSTGEWVIEKLAAGHLPIQRHENYPDSPPLFGDQPESADGVAEVPRRIVLAGGAMRGNEVAGKGAQGHKTLDRRLFRPLLRRYRHFRERRAIMRSRLFFSQFYLDANPDVAQLGVDPLDHFIAFGSGEGRAPNPLFSEEFYRATYPDISEHSVTTGLTHYIRAGWRERRDPHPDFSTSYYLSSNPDVEMSEVNPLFHYLLHGIKEGRAAKWRRDGGLKAPDGGRASPMGRPRVAPPKLKVRPPDRPGSLNGPYRKEATTPRDWLTGREYARRSHWPEFEAAAHALMGKMPSPDDSDLKVYQDLFTAEFIRRFVPKGARILEVGGGESRILKHFSSDYECWNLDKLEGRGNGPKDSHLENVTLVRDYIGDFSPDLPENYFDFVFSISVLEHFPAGKPELYTTAWDDIARVSRAGCQHLHLVDVVCKQEQRYIWACDVLKDWLAKLAQRDWSVFETSMLNDSDLFVMRKIRYERTWRHVTGQSYEEFGAPSSFNLFWKSGERTDT